MPTMSQHERMTAACGLAKRPREAGEQQDATDLLDRWLAFSHELLKRDFFWRSEIDGALIGLRMWGATSKWAEPDDRAIRMIERLTAARERAATPDLRP